MDSSPLVTLLLIAVGLGAIWLWTRDYAAARRGTPVPGGLPGATGAPTRAIVLGLVVGLALVAAETGGEMALGITAEQKHLTWLFAAWTLVAAFVEEIVFRGYLVVTQRGRALLWASIVGFSLLFALLHPFLWVWDDEGWRLTLTLKGAFSTTAAFIASLAFYAMRFNGWNPGHSLLPCFAAHFVKNLGVIAVKAAQGFLGTPPA